MPPRRTRTTASTKSSGSSGKASALAKSLSLSAEQEDEIRNAWELFLHEEASEEAGEPAVLTEDVDKVLMALKLECEKSEFADILEVIDPSEDGYVIWPRFLEVVAALKMKQTDDGDDEEEVEEAFRLFTKGEKITAADLRRIAEDLKEHVTEEQIRDMILEAGGGEEGGVGRRQFGEVMRRAGAL